MDENSLRTRICSQQHNMASLAVHNVLAQNSLHVGSRDGVREEHHLSNEALGCDPLESDVHHTVVIVVIAHSEKGLRVVPHCLSEGVCFDTALVADCLVSTNKILTSNAARRSGHYLQVATPNSTAFHSR